MTEAELIEQLPGLTNRRDIRNWLSEATGLGLTPGLVAAVAAQAELTAASGTSQWVSLLFLQLPMEGEAELLADIPAYAEALYPRLVDFRQTCIVADYLGRRYRDEADRRVLWALTAGASGEAGRAGRWMAWELVWKLGDTEERAEAERRMRLLG
jgi:hypothetical protein